MLPEQVVSSPAPSRSWIYFSFGTIFFFGIWGAIIPLPEKNGFSAELGFVMWAVSMMVPSFFALYKCGFTLDTSPRAILFGFAIGLLGGVGQLILYTGAITNGPAYLIFPIISLSPVVTILLSTIFLKERVSRLGALGITAALIAIPFINYSPDSTGINGSAWLIYALLVFVAWGVQGYYLKLANNSVSAESIFFYMALSGLMISPIAFLQADKPFEANWGACGAGLAFAIGLLNSIGALFLVYAFRYGKAIVVSPMVNCLPPIITSLLALLLAQVLPNFWAGIGMLIAIFSAYVLAISEEN
jgi:drug/metabolite transporter (DMT)-like permease